MTYLTNLFMALDAFLNCLLLGGSPGQTISVHAALARRRGAPWACALCAVLGRLVQRDHCAKTLAPGATPAPAALRAALLLSLLVAALWWLGRLLLSTLAEAWP